MKLGKYAKGREKRILRYLYKEGASTQEKMQLDLYKQSPINVAHPLADLLKMGLVRACRNSLDITLISLTEKGSKYTKRRLGVKKCKCLTRP